jgi:DNA-binding Lrp family transcriptional regulator
MDSLDTSILIKLKNNCRLSYQALAQQHGLTAPAIRKRVIKMIESGVIVRFTLEASQALLGVQSFLALISTNGIHREDFVTLIGENPMVANVLSCDGWKYIIIGSFDNSYSVFNFAEFLRQLEGVIEVKIHLLLTPLDKNVAISKTQIRVLRSLHDDSRKKLSEIADETGLSTRTVRKVVKQILESRVIHFTLHWNPSANDNIGLLVQLCFNHNNLKLNGTLEWLRRNYQSQFLSAYISALEPMIYGIFIVRRLENVTCLMKTIRQSSCIKLMQCFIIRNWQTFPDLKKMRLEKILYQE